MPRWASREPTRTATWAAAVVYAVALSVTSLQRHHAFRTGGYDVGIFDQAVWLLGHGLEPFSTIRGRNVFADHFQPALILLAPLGAIGVTPTALFLLQSALLAAVAPALYALARLRGASNGLALAVALLWLASPPTQWANLFEYHTETIVPVCLALSALALERGRVGTFVATAVLASCAKEDVCLVYLMWGVVLAFGPRRRLGVALTFGAAAWFAFATKIALPAFGGSLDYYSRRFAGDRGTSLGAVFLTLLEHPLRTIGDTATPTNARILVTLIACTGGLALLAPRMLVPALPPVAANLLSAYPYQHVLHFHYYVVSAAVFAVASAFGAGVLTQHISPRRRHTAAITLIAAALVFSAVASPAAAELRRKHRTPEITAKRVAISRIPPDVPVAAANDLAPHLSNRREIYQLPEPYFARPTNGEAWTAAELRRRALRVQYVAYDTDSLDPFPKQQVERIPAMLRRQGFVEIYRTPYVRVFRRR
jgi:uncharacterized membrane protein